jgi:hypothetical protein
MIGRRALLRAWSLPLLCAPLISACSTDPRREDVARLIRDGDFSAARNIAEKLVARGDVDGQMPLLAGALALQAGDFTRADELFAADPADDASQAPFASGLAQVHWRRLASMRSRADAVAGSGTLVSDPVADLVAGRLSPEAFVRVKVEEARRLADAMILSVQQSTGRDALLDQRAREDEPLYRCTGNFVAGERSLAGGDPASANRFLSAALEPKAGNLLEFHIAKAELARLA